MHEMNIVVKEITQPPKPVNKKNMLSMTQQTGDNQSRKAQTLKYSQQSR